MKNKTRIFILIIAVLALSSLALLYNDTARETSKSLLERIGLWREFHIHADFKVFLDGKPVDFTAAKYQSTADAVLDRGLHLHDQDGVIFHMHERGVTLSRAFSSLGMGLTNECFSLDTGETHCNTGEKMLRMFVNGKPSHVFGEYVFKDLDKILISYGAEEEAMMQAQTITEISCIFSKKCPERGMPPEEGCVAGAGCPVDYSIE